MAFLTQEKLKAADCTKLILSMWFKVPETLPTRQDSEGVTGGNDGDDENPTAGEELVEHSYLLMEWGNYQQTSHKRWYVQDWILFTDLAYDTVLPFHDAERIGWVPRPTTTGFDYGLFPTPPANVPGDVITAVYDFEGAGNLGLFPPVFPVPHVVIANINTKFGYFTLDSGGDPNDVATWSNWTGGDAVAWGLKTPDPGFGNRWGAPLSPPQSSEVWLIDNKEFDHEYYNYRMPSCIYISGFKDHLTVTVNIAGAVFGPLGPTIHTFLFAPSASFPGYTVAPSLTVACPSTKPFTEDEIPVGGAEKPYVTQGKWHHLLLCVNLNGDSMIEIKDGTQTETNRGSARYRECTMFALLDGVKYGDTIWPVPIPEGFSDTLEAQSIHEDPYLIPSTAVQAYSELQDTSFNTRNGILVRDETISLPYHKQWERTDPAEYNEYNEPPSSVTAQGLTHLKGNYPYTNGWHGGTKGFDIVSTFLSSFASEALNRVYPIPAAQTDPTITGENRSPSRTVDIKREYSDVQIWFGKYIDPTDYNNLKLFLDITRNDQGNLVGNIPPLDGAARTAYADLQINDPTVKVLSLAAAPNNLGQPDVYLAGGASSFIHDRGKEGDVMVKIGTINDVAKPIDIPIPESAVKPQGL